MNTILKALKSRTVWAIVLMFIVGGVSSVHNLIPSGLYDWVQSGLGLLAVYFKLNPSQVY